MKSFAEALETGDLDAVRKFEKSDLHNHGMMGGRLSRLSDFLGRRVPAFSDGKDGVHGINAWIGKVLKPVTERPGAFEFMMESAFLQAGEDGITVLEMSIDATLGNLVKLSAQEMVDVLKSVHSRVAPGIEFRPELGLSRMLPVRSVFRIIEPFLETGYFRSVDLYDIEDAQPVENFRELYSFFRQNGLKCKAHAGEFGDAESVRKAAEVLQLDAIQHGIGAAGSEEVMKWLASRQITLNVSPVSNIILKRASSWKTHPLRILFDHEVKVTIATDDVLLFDQGNSEQYLELFKCGAFSAAELDQIRENGLKN